MEYCQRKADKLKHPVLQAEQFDTVIHVYL